jgi:hypothetical protein
MGVGFVLWGGVDLLLSYFALTIAPQHAPPMVRVIAEVALVIMDVAPVLLGCGLVLWLVGGMASAMCNDAAPDAAPDATPAMVDHNVVAVPDATDRHAVRHMPGHVRRQHGSEENGHAPRAVSHLLSLFDSSVIAGVFKASLLLGTMIGIITLIPDMVLGRVTVGLLGSLVLHTVGIAVVLTTFCTVLIAIPAVVDWHEQARRLRMRHGSER